MSRQVLIYVNQVSPADLTGQGTYERELTAALRDQVGDRADLAVVTIRQPGERPAGDPNVIAVPLDKRSPISYLLHQIRLVATLCWLLLRHLRDDVVIYSRYAPSSLAPALLATLFRRRLVIRTYPAFGELDAYRSRVHRLARLAVQLTDWCNCRAAAVIIVVTDRTREMIERHHPFAASKIVIVPNGVAVDRFPLQQPDRARWGLADGGLVLGFVGFLNAIRGLDTVIRAMALIQRRGGQAPQLLVVGDGPCREPWHALAHTLGVADRVVFAGAVPHARVASAISACDVMVAPFTRAVFEVTGSSALKLFEYLACDKPVLASRGDDHAFLVASHVGSLAEPEDAESWADAIACYQAAPIDLAGRGRRLVQERYSFQSIADRVFGLCFPIAMPHGTLTPSEIP